MGTENAETIARALGGKKSGRQWLCKCPAHDDGNASLLIFDGYKRAQFRCQAGCEPLDVLAAIRGCGGPWSEPFGRDNHLELTEAQRIAGARHVFDRASPASGTATETYLAARGLTLPTPDRLRHAVLKHKPAERYFPAMVALVTDHRDRPLGIHRTYINHEGTGKAPVDEPKMMLGPTRGGAVRLAPVATELMVGEGIESVLSAMQVTGRPGWAALSTSGLIALVLPPDVHDVLILADGDDPGEAAAQRAADRWLREGRKVRIARPPFGSDFNDMLLHGTT